MAREESRGFEVPRNESDIYQQVNNGSSDEVTDEDTGLQKDGIPSPAVHY